MKKAMFAATAAAVGMTCTLSTSALAQLPPKAAPQGMLQITTGESTGGGRILTSRIGGASSAHKMLQALKMVSGEYFDKPFVITRAFADKSDQNLQAAFTARLKGVPVHGVASVMMQGEVGQGTLLFDEAKTFTKSFARLVGRQNGGGAVGQNAAPPVTLTPQAVPDGSGQISLPPGFQIAGAYKGTLDIVGPNGAAMVLGAPTVCTSRQAGAMYPGLPAVDFSSPERALVDYINYMSRKAGVPATVKILDVKPVSGFAGQAAYIRYHAEAAGKSAEFSDCIPSA